MGIFVYSGSNVRPTPKPDMAFQSLTKKPISIHGHSITVCNIARFRVFNVARHHNPK